MKKFCFAALLLLTTGAPVALSAQHAIDYQVALAYSRQVTSRLNILKIKSCTSDDRLLCRKLTDLVPRAEQLTEMLARGCQSCSDPEYDLKVQRFFLAFFESIEEMWRLLREPRPELKAKIEALYWTITGRQAPPLVQ